MLRPRFSLLVFLGVTRVGAIVVDEDPTKSGDCAPPLTDAVALVYTPVGNTASGTLLPGGRYILTAAHVVSDLAEDTLARGLIKFPSCPGKPRRHWKAVHLHPKAEDLELSRVWDAALIELDSPLPEDVVAGVPIRQRAVEKGLMVHLVGYGQQGDGLLGNFRPPGTLSHGRNRFDQNPTPSLLVSLGLPVDCGPLLIHRFDPGHREGHFAPGDSGGPGLLAGPDGRVRIASLNLGRHRGPSDHDHRLNGSFGELGLSLDVSALRPWLEPFLSQPQKTQSEKPNSQKDEM